MKDAWLGIAIAKYLKENRYSQADMCRATGLDRYKMSMSLRGKRRFSFREYELICGALGLDTNFFLKPRKERNTQ